MKNLMDSDDVDVEEELLDECVLAETTPERSSSSTKCPALKGGGNQKRCVFGGHASLIEKLFRCIFMKITSFRGIRRIVIKQT